MVRLGSVVAAAALLVFLAGCGESESELCDSLGDLQTSADELRDVDLGENALDQVQQAVDDMQADFDAVEDAAGDELRPAVADLRTAAETLRDDVEAAAEGGFTGDELQAVATSASAVMTAFDGVREAAPECDLAETGS